MDKRTMSFFSAILSVLLYHSGEVHLCETMAVAGDCAVRRIGLADS